MEGRVCKCSILAKFWRILARLAPVIPAAPAEPDGASSCQTENIFLMYAAERTRCPGGATLIIVGPAVKNRFGPLRSDSAGG